MGLGGRSGEKQIPPLRYGMTTEEAVDGANRSGVPWFVWVGTAAVTCAYLGGEWDVAWHRSIGADTFWSPPHLLIYACAVLAGVVSLWLVVRSTRAGVAGVRFFGLRGPLGVFVAGWGGAAMLTAAPFDQWWHAAYGLDIKMVSPPHVLLIAGIRAIAVGMVLLLMAELNRAFEAGDAGATKKLQRLCLWLGGMAVASQMYFVQEFTLQPMLHRASVYVVVGAALTGVLTAVHEASRVRWAAVWAASIYMAVVWAEVLVLPLVPAHPRLGPVLFPVTHLAPAAFPLLLIPAAAGVDLVLQRVPGWWPGAAAAGVAFVVLLFAFEWPFANFLMSPAARGRVFGADYFGYLAEPSGFARTHVLFFPQHGIGLLIGLVEACVGAAVSAGLGLVLGRWMRGVRR